MKEDSPVPLKSKNEFKNKNILLVNTGSVKKRFILQKIKKLGPKIIVLNKEKNWADKYVDHWILAETTNHQECIQKVAKFIRENGKQKIDGVITFWEDDVLLTSKIVDKFNLIGIPYTVANKARNKFLFREFCAKHNLPYVKHTIISNSKDIARVLKYLKFPMVIKPVYGSSSAYVMKLEDEEQLRNAFQYLKRSMSTPVESALSDGIDILIEEYIDGDEVDIDIIIQNGRIKYWAISDNDLTNEPFFLETGHSIPSSLPENEQRALLAMAYETLEKLGVQNGCIHYEAKSTKLGPVPLEVNLRMGGDEIYSFSKGAWNVDLIENALKIALGIYVPKIVKPENPYKYLAERDFLAEKSGILSKFNIDPDIEKEKNVEDIQFFKKVGDTVLVPPEGYDNLGWITVSGDNLIDAEDNLENAIKHIEFEVSRFQTASSIGRTLWDKKLPYSMLNRKLILRRGKIEKIRQMQIIDQRKLHIGVACNVYDEKTALTSVEKELSSVGNFVEKILKERGYEVSFFDFNNLSKAFNNLRRSDIDLVFNLCERINDSSLLEPHAAAILDTLQIPYTGSNPFTLSLCIDKIRVKKLLSYHEIPTPEWDYVYSMDDEISEDLEYPLIVKPANTDNSIGITNDSVVVNKKELKRQLEKVIMDIKSPALIEEYIEGDEYDVSILGNSEDDLRVLPLSRTIFDKLPGGLWHIYPYEAKYDKAPVYQNKIIVQRPPKKVNKKLLTLISEISLDTYNILHCADYGRVEVKIDRNNNPYVLELNPNPSINKNDCIPSVSRLVGLDYGDLLEEIIRMAIFRYKNNPPYYHLQANII